MRDIARGADVARGVGQSPHVLLPFWVLARRANGVAVIGAALLAKAAGRGHRAIAAELGRPVSTVRGWLRRFAARAQGLWVLFLVAAFATNKTTVDESSARAAVTEVTTD